MTHPHFFNIDSRRQMIIPGGHQETIQFMAEHFCTLAKSSILTHGFFYVALSGGSTPKAIYQALKNYHRNSIDWKKVMIFFSDERAVSPDDQDSNYFSAMQNGIGELGIPSDQIFRMKAESSIQENALNYEALITKHIPSQIFDLIMLGMGDDGHTASLFPHSEGLKVENRSVISNYIPSKKSDRMTFTFPIINQAKNAVFYAVGNSKKEMLKTVLTPNFRHFDFPATIVGTEKNRALWIVDRDAASLID